MANCAIVGINWGDEGKGRMVDLLASEYDVVVRYQGGNNAGHTVINQYGKFALHLIPSGIFRPEVINLLGNGTVIDPEALLDEMQSLQAAGVSITPENFKISDRATIVFPYHRAQDALEEERLKGILEWKNLTIQNVYGAEPYDYDTLMAWLEKFGGQLRPYICDAGSVLRLAQLRGKNILFEAQLGALRDIDYGIYPYTSSSTPLAAYAPIGCGAPDLRVDEVLGIVKAYSTCVGEGPFTAEWFGAEADKLREAGGEYGAATGRPRRVGPLDLVATRYGVKVQGATSIALTKLDILSYMEEIPVCIAYDIDGKKTEAFPFPSQLAKAKPVIETLPGWGCDISGVRYWEDLPQAAQDYVTYVEDQIGCPITYVSVGADRDAIIQR